MSIAGNRISLRQDIAACLPAEAQLNGEETLADFVEMIRKREKSKRTLLPDLAPDVYFVPKRRPIVGRLKDKLFCN